MLDLNIFIAKFVDDTEIRNSELPNPDSQSLEEDLHKLSVWSERWDMTFINVDTYNIHEVGTRNQKI